MLNEATQRFITQHKDDDVRQLALRGSRQPDVDVAAALQQIAGRQVARRKLPTWAATEGMLYPPHLSLEQCSSETAARYKASVVASLLAEKCDETDGFSSLLVDLTGGMGADFSFLAPLFGQAVYVERQEHLCLLARNNFPLLGLSHAQIVCNDCEAHLHQMGHATVIFVDPARRDLHGGRTYGMADCTPDVLSLRDELLAKADYVVLKLSPMLDWQKAVADLGRQWVRQVHTVSVNNECKELLLVLSQKGEGMQLVCWNDGVAFIPQQEAEPVTAERADDQAMTYLYEPNASIMKAGCFQAVERQLGVRQLAPNSHLFSSARCVEHFPGRVFSVTGLTSMNKRDLKAALSGVSQANITVRNFPLSVAELRKRLKISEGGSLYIFATTLASGSHVLVLCRRVA